MARLARAAAVALGMVLILAGPATAKPRAPKHPPIPPLYGPEKVRFEEVHARLVRGSRVTVSSACGSTVAPWAYRGPRGEPNSRQAFRTERVGGGWTRRFIATLMQPADWDSVKRFRGSSRSCKDSTDVPQVVVRFASNPDVYALLVFPSRQAVVFEDDHPLGSVAMGDRADSLFALVREALPREPGLEFMPASVPPRPRADADTALAYGDTLSLDALPEAVERAYPSYPEAARRAQVEGTVYVQALIGRDGRVRDAFVRNLIPGLEDAALDAVWKWRFKPASYRGKPYAVWVLAPVTFRLR